MLHIVPSRLPVETAPASLRNWNVHASIESMPEEDTVSDSVRTDADHRHGTCSSTTNPATSISAFSPDNCFLSMSSADRPRRTVPVDRLCWKSAGATTCESLQIELVVLFAERPHAPVGLNIVGQIAERIGRIKIHIAQNTQNANPLCWRWSLFFRVYSFYKPPIERYWICTNKKDTYSTSPKCSPCTLSTMNHLSWPLSNNCECWPICLNTEYLIAQSETRMKLNQMVLNSSIKSQYKILITMFDHNIK